MPPPLVTSAVPQLNAHWSGSGTVLLDSKFSKTRRPPLEVISSSSGCRAADRQRRHRHVGDPHVHLEIGRQIHGKIAPTTSAMIMPGLDRRVPDHWET